MSIDEKSYEHGSRRAWLSMLRKCLFELRCDDQEADKFRWILEREEAISALREICSEHGDNDWDEKLHLADIIERHLNSHLEQPL